MPRAGLSHDAVVALALEVVDEGGPRGFAQLTLAAVAERAGVATPSLYKHVGGLPALRREVARIAVEHLTATLSAAAAASTRDPADALRAMAHALREQARALPGRYSALQGASWVLDPEATAVRAAAGETVAVIAEQLTRLGVPESRRIDAVRAFRAAVHGFIALELDGGFGLPDDVDVSFDYLVDGLVDALATTGAATTTSQ
ncbi:TetR/AcrR family transcriptional regulator [Cellulomonas timonensis]|uniref:TetR/AcrR family transcriptional regulator n=1 Tax=Cellulomonas timonensis TaxID=1689271 RepID=UPI00082DFBA5|nr:TetR/AcrR family transcriptional regulator [Cellulomonas timonensis]